MFPAREVSSSVVEMVVGASDRGGVPLNELVHGLPVDAQRLRRRTHRLDWEHFVTILERLDSRIGAERFDEVCAQLPALAPNTRRLLGVFVSERLLFRFVNRFVGPSSYPMMHTRYEEDGHVGHLQLRLRDGMSGSRTVFRVFTAAISAMPCFIGHAPAVVRSEVTARGGDYWIQLPRDEGLRARMKRASDFTEWEALLETVEEDKARFLEVNEAAWRRSEDTIALKLAAAKARWTLTPRQVDVLSGLSRGLSNKALTTELDCSVKTVETHVTELLRRSGAESRLALVAMFWREL